MFRAGPSPAIREHQGFQTNFIALTSFIEPLEVLRAQSVCKNLLMMAAADASLSSQGRRNPSFVMRFQREG